MYIRKQTNPNYSNRIDKEEVKRLYKKREIHTISLNDQLESFYNKCTNNRFRKHEVTYFFHAENLSFDELESYQTKFRKSSIRLHDSEVSKTSFIRFLAVYMLDLFKLKLISSSTSD